MTQRAKTRRHRKVAAERWGRMAEYWVALRLILRGYKIIHFRFRCPHGEIDLITQRKQTIHFIEVKYRQRYDHIEQALPSNASRHRLMNTAAYYMARLPDGHKYDQNFSVVIVSKTLQLVWFHHAFYDLS